MKKIICFMVVIYALINTMNLSAQWFDNNGMFELSEKIPDIQNLKIFPDDNLIITVSKDNTIRLIAYDSGKITKTIKPDSITANNDFATISTDGKTTIMGNIITIPGIKSQLNKLREIKIYIIDNSSGNILGEHLVTYDKMFTEPSNLHWIDGFGISYAFCDYDYKNSIFLTIFNISYAYTYGGGIYKSFDLSYLTNGVLINNHYVINKECRQARIDDIIYENNKLKSKFWAVFSYDRTESGGGSPTDFYEYSGFSKFNKNLDSFITYVEFRYHNKELKNYFIKLKQLFNSISVNEYFLTAPNILYKYDVLEKKFIDSIQNKIFNNNIEITNNGHYIHVIDNKIYSIYSYPNFKEIVKYDLKKNLKFAKPIVDGKLGSTFFYFADSTIGMLKPEIMKPINNIGFIISKDTVYTNEIFKSYAITSIDSCKYEWEFFPGFIDKQNTKDVSYKYDKPGQYNIKLTITTPDGKPYIYEKQKVITVLQNLKADFDITILNSDLPVKVQFTNKSIGAFLKYKWNFGDGFSDTTENPIHEYIFSGDFSPSLYIYDGISNSTLTTFENILINTQVPEYLKADTVYTNQSGDNYLKRIFSLDSGFCLYYEKKAYTLSVYDDFAKNYHYLGRLYNDFYIFNNNFKLNEKFTLENGVRDSIGGNPYLFSLEQMLENANIIIHWSFDYRPYDRIYNIYNKKGILEYNTFGNSIYCAKTFLNSKNNTFFCLYSNDSFSGISKLDYNLKFLWQTPIAELAKPMMFFADPLDTGMNLLILNPDYSFIYYSLAGDGTIKLITNPIINNKSYLYNIKSVNDNFLFIYGKYLNSQIYRYHAFLAKYDPINNKYQDAIFNGRADIQKLVRINNKYYAAIGTSRGTQGYLILDTNLNQIKDIRVPGLYGNLKDIIVKNNKVYLFTETVISLPTEALSANQSYETDVTVLSLPSDIISDVEENHVVASENIIKIYPNPARDYIVVQSSEGSDIQIFDMLGVIQSTSVCFAATSASGGQRIDVSHLSPGIYFIKIGNRVEKLVKM